MAKAKKVKPVVITALGPKVLLDAEILSELNYYYSARLGDDVLGRECFSDPKMDSHICNPKAAVPGGGICKVCGGIEGRPCKITCDAHHFCLATYATRFGIGVAQGKLLTKSIRSNLSDYTYQVLYDLVMAQKAANEVKPPTPEEMAQKIAVEANPEAVENS